MLLVERAFKILIVFVNDAGVLVDTYEAGVGDITETLDVTSVASRVRDEGVGNVDATASLEEVEGGSIELLNVDAVKDCGVLYEEVEGLLVTYEGPETTDVSMTDPEVIVTVEVDRACSFKLVFVIIKLDGWSGILVAILVSSKVELCGRDSLEKVVSVDDFSKLNGTCELDNVLEAKLLEY